MRLPVAPALAFAAEFLQSQWTTTSDPYDLAQIALAVFSAGKNDLGAKVNAKLRTVIHQQGDALYWAMETNTLFYGCRRSGTRSLLGGTF